MERGKKHAPERIVSDHDRSVLRPDDTREAVPRSAHDSSLLQMGTFVDHGLKLPISRLCGNCPSSRLCTQVVRAKKMQRSAQFNECIGLFSLIEAG